MHPILASKKRLGLYLLAWVPVVFFLASLMEKTQGVDWAHALSLAFPTSMVYAFVCLAAWYPVRALPIRSDDWVRLILTHLTSALVASGLFVLTGHLGSEFLGRYSAFWNTEVAWADLLPVNLSFGVVLYFFSVVVHYHLATIEEVAEKEKRALEMSMRANEAELKALKAQVHPHFLFNSLNSISALTSADAVAARRMCLLLAEFLRTSLAVAKESSIPLEKELQLAQDYLAIEQVRFGDRLHVKTELSPEVSAFPVPPLLLQPLVENAVSHGISGMVEGGAIQITTSAKNGALRVVIENPVDPESPSRPGEGLGLENVRRRLATLPGESGRIWTDRTDNLYRVEIEFPGESE